MSQSPIPTPSLPRSLTALETWGLGFSGLLLWLGVAPDIHAALGTAAIWVWLPGSLVGILLNLQVKQLGLHYRNVVGGTPNYTTRLLQQFPTLARYSAIGYLLGWVSVPSINAIILTNLIQENLTPLGISCPVGLLRMGFTTLPFVVALSGIRALSILHTFFVFPAIGFLTTFCLQGLGWLSFSPASPGWSISNGMEISVVDWMKWFLIATYAVYSCETASSFVAESRQPSLTLRCLSVTACFIPIVYGAGSWVMMRLAAVPESGNSAYLSLVSAASPFWGTHAPALVTFLITSGCLLSSTTAVANSPRILYQLAIDGYLPPVFSTVSRRGVPEPSLMVTFLLSLLCLLWGDVHRIVTVTGMGYLLAIAAVHGGLWLNRQRPETRWPWISLGFLGIEITVLAMGGWVWGWQNGLIGVLLLVGIDAIATGLPRLPFAVFHPDWWQQRYCRQPTCDSRTDWVAFQAIAIILLVCGAVTIGWLVRSKLEHEGIESHTTLFSILLLTVAFVSIAIACWTSLSQITTLTETQRAVEQMLHELQETQAKLQELNQELEQRVQQRTQELEQEVHIRQQAELKFQKIFQISPHAIAITSLQDRRIIEINDAFCRLFGYEREEMIDRSADEFTLFMNPAEQGLVQRQLIDLGSVRNLECNIRTKTGEARTAIASAEFIDIYDYHCFLVIGNDITERKQAQDALGQSEARFQKIAAASPAQIYILVTDTKGSLLRFEYVSPAVSEVREIPPDRLLQDPTPVYDQIHPDDRAGYWAARDRSLEKMVPFFHEYRIVLPSGQVKWVRVNARPECQENGEIFWYGILLDVSDRKQVEAALLRSERWLQNFSQQIITMVYTLVQHPNGSSWFEYISPTCETLLEISVEEAMRNSSSILDLIDLEERPTRFTAISYRQPPLEPYRSEYRIVTPSGELKWMQTYAQIESREDRTLAWYGVLIDISDRKRIENERQQIETQLRASLKEKEVLLREVYHRVKNNMQLVSSLLRLQTTTTDDPKILRLLNESQQRVKTMALIHERLYRSENLARLNIATYIQDLVNDLVRSYTTATSSIQVTLELADLELDLDRAVPCGLIINELVSNAFKYAFPQQQGEIQLRLWLEDSNRYCLMVKDNGVGIPDCIDPQRTDSLGMQLVYGLTEQMGGSIELDTQEGSQFKLIFRRKS